MQLLALVSFVVVASATLIGALVNASEEAYTHWTDSGVLGLAIFACANAVAAVLVFAGLAGATRRSRSVELAGALLLVPGVWLVNRADSLAGSARWIAIAGAAVLVVVGGVLVSGLRSGAASEGRR